MTLLRLLKSNLFYYWRTNIAVVLGVAVAVAVLAGALIVGDSVRSSLRNIFLQRLGRTDLVVASTGFVREQLSNEISARSDFGKAGFDGACPLIVVTGAVAHEESGRRGIGIHVYGVDERFWNFHNQTGTEPPKNREALLSEALAAELSAGANQTLLLRIEKPSDIPVESLHGRKEELGKTIRLTMRQSLPAALLGDFSVRPQQSAARSLFIPLSLLQKELKQEGKVNAILVSSNDDDSLSTARVTLFEKVLRESIGLEDLGVRLRRLDGGRGTALETESAMVNEPLAESARTAASEARVTPLPIYSYLANTIRSGDREIPYSLVTAVEPSLLATIEKEESTTQESPEKRKPSSNVENTDSSDVQVLEDAPGGPADGLPPIVLNEWAAKDLGASVGAPIELEYYLWRENGGLATNTARFRLARIVPIAGLAADRDLVPSYPGITESQSLSDWDPPFPIDLSRIRQKDEDYWDDYRTTPKAFIPIDVARQLWHTRFGKQTSLRVIALASDGSERLDAFEKSLRNGLDPMQLGLGVYSARSEGLEASQGSTNFGEYFLYFSFFLVVSALLLMALFFRLGVEQRLREIGTLQSIGIPAAKIRNLMLGEGAILALLGSVLGLAGAYVYSALVMYGLRTWWVGAVGTTALALQPTATSFVTGALAGIGAALLCVIWTLRRFTRSPTRSLLNQIVPGTERVTSAGRTRVIFVVAISFLLIGIGLLIAALAGVIPQVAGFFGGGSALLVALLCFQSVWLRRSKQEPIKGSGWWPVSRLGLRNATHRTGRSILCITLISFAAFIIVAVDAFRRDDQTAVEDRNSGTGGYALLAESLLPIVHDPNTPEGQEALTIGTSQTERETLSGVRFERFRLRPGDDASCLNLYKPRNPRIVAPTAEFLSYGRFDFQDAQSQTEEEKQNPWLLLNREFADGAIPVIADANSISYVLHLKLGDDFVLEREGGPVRLRLVAALADSIFQSELVMSEKHFLRLFPDEQGARLFLLDASPEQSHRVAAMLEDRLADFGFDVTRTSERLATFHRVENTFLSTFQTLGGLGLVLGTFGLAAVLLRNVLERRRELALLRAVGYESKHFAMMIIAENSLLLLCGLITGTICALLAVGPAVAARGGQLPVLSLGALLVAVAASGLMASLLATFVALRSPLLTSLRAE